PIECSSHTMLLLPKISGIRLSNASRPNSTPPRHRSLNFLSLDWGGNMRFVSIRAVATLVVVAMSKLGLPVAAAVLTAAFSQLALAQMSPAQRFELAPDGQPIRDVSLATQSVTVFLKMAGDPVAVVRSRAPGRPISG